MLTLSEWERSRSRLCINDGIVLRICIRRPNRCSVVWTLQDAGARVRQGGQDAQGRAVDGAPRKGRRHRGGGTRQEVHDRRLSDAHVLPRRTTDRLRRRAYGSRYRQLDQEEERPVGGDPWGRRCRQGKRISVQIHFSVELGFLNYVNLLFIIAYFLNAVATDFRAAHRGDAAIIKFLTLLW